jgi:hypothetical protein
VKRLMLTCATTFVLGAVAPTAGAAVVPFGTDSMGPLVDVTAHWQDYQPASAFCIKPDARQYTPGGAGATATGLDAACRRSGFPVGATGLVKVAIRTPILCAGCRRVFIDFSKIPATGGAHGHVYYHLASFNPTYTVDPIAHSPNTKNFTNDKLLSPTGSLQEKLIGAFDLHAIAYVTDTSHFVHNALQGPYYAGPWYLNRHGARVYGVYLDVDIADAARLPIAALNTIVYADGFDSGRLCPGDDDLLYAGCLDDWGLSASGIDPFAK